jgi:hypothetical protein
MDLDVLLVDYFQNTSVVWKLRHGRRCGMVVQVLGELSGSDGVDLLRGVLSAWDEVDFLRGLLSGWDGVDFLRGLLSGWDGIDFLRGVLSGWDGEDFLRGVLSGWVEMNFDDDVEERSDRCLRKSGQSLGDSGRNQKNDRSQRNNHCRVDDRLQMNHHSRIVFWSDLGSKNENDDVLDNKDLDRIDDHELVRAHREDRHAYLKKRQDSTRLWELEHSDYYGSMEAG